MLDGALFVFVLEAFVFEAVFVAMYAASWSFAAWYFSSYVSRESMAGAPSCCRARFQFLQAIVQLREEAVSWFQFRPCFFTGSWCAENKVALREFAYSIASSCDCAFCCHPFCSDGLSIGPIDFFFFHFAGNFWVIVTPLFTSVHSAMRQELRSAYLFTFFTSKDSIKISQIRVQWRHMSQAIDWSVFLSLWIA